MEPTNSTIGYPYLPHPTRVAKTLITSASLWLGGAAAVACRFEARKWVVPTVGFTTLAFGLEKRKKLVFEFSLTLTQYRYREGNWMSDIDDKIVLGGLPLIEEGHLQALQEKGITLVICMVEDWELAPGWRTTPVTKADYDREGIRFVHLPSADFGGVSQENLRAVEEAIRDDDKVYCHCKAGHGRGPSAAVVALVAKGMTVDDAIVLLKEKRPRITLREHQKAPLVKFAQIRGPTAA